MNDDNQDDLSTEELLNNPPASDNQSSNMIDPSRMGILNEIKIVVTIEIGRTSLKIKDLLNLSKDSVIDLNKNAGEPVDIYANGKLISKGTIITVNGKYCVKLTSMPNVSQ
jgi:flagellar motor switch protein FliN/FliY